MDPLAERFRTERERLGLSIRHLAQETKIREPYIEALERGRYDILPAVYVRSFIKNLGIALRIPSDEIAQLMSKTFDEESTLMETLPAYKPEPPPREPLISFSDAAQRTSDFVNASVDRVRTMAELGIWDWATKRNLVIGLGIVFAIGILIWFSGIGGSANSLDGEMEVVEVVDPSIIPDTDSLILTAVVSDTAWLSITMDGKRTQQVVIHPESEYRWSAMKQFQVSLSNAGGVQFFRNGYPLPVFGKSGEALRSVVITRTDVIASNTTFKPPTPLETAKPRTETVQVKAQPSAVTPIAPKVVQRAVSKPPPPKRFPARQQQRAPIRKQDIPIITPAPLKPVKPN